VNARLSAPAQRSTGRRRPPYADRWDALLADGRPIWGSSEQGLTGWLLAGTDAWNLARSWANSRRLFLCCPPDADPQGLDWRQLAQASPPVLLLGPELTLAQLDRVAAAVLRDGTARLFWPYLRPGGVFGLRYIAEGGTP
jgi:hypothetical protein